MSAHDPAFIKALADEIADRLVELQPPAEPLLAPKELAQRLGVSTTWVYGHKDDLGALSLPGQKSRLWFSWPTVYRRLEQSAMTLTTSAPQRSTRRTRKAAAASNGRGAGLLPIGSNASEKRPSGRATDTRNAPRPGARRMSPDAP